MLRSPFGFFWVGLLWGAGVVTACGYHATPITLQIEATVYDAGDVKQLALAGTADPAGSEFDEGLLLSTRWSVARGGVRVVELLLDLDRQSWPDSVEEGDSVLLSIDNGTLRAVVRQRDGYGKVIHDHLPGTGQVTLTQLKKAGGRYLSSGSFLLEQGSAPDGLYEELGGVWETRPRPGADSVLSGDFGPVGPPDGASGDAPAIGDGPAGDKATGPDPKTGDSIQPPALVFEKTGCACPGGDVEEELPPEEPDETEPSESDSGGCDCGGDTTEEEAPLSDAEPEASGCDCQGDDSEPDPDSSTDTTGDEESSGGCDCQGDDPEDPGTELACWEAPTRGGLTFSQLATVPPPPVTPKIRRRSRRRCHQSLTRSGLQLSPVVVVYWLARRRRHRR